MGCDVTALEPSIGMRGLLYAEAMQRGIDWIKIDDSRWEDAQAFHFADYDLVMSCNSLHLTGQGFEQSLRKTFETGAKNIFVITERLPKIKLPWVYGNYSMSFVKSYETESSFAYHQMSEVWGHHVFKKGSRLCPEEEREIRSKLIFEDDHICIKDRAYVSMYWWQRSRRGI
jgi:hypothetical protein